MMYPEVGGLLPIGALADVDHLNWLTKGNPNKWDVVYWYSDGHDFIHLKGDSLTRFVRKILKGQYRAKQIPRLAPPYDFEKSPRS
jgi:hypothetical protein